MNGPGPYQSIFISCVGREHTALRSRIVRDLSLGGHRVIVQDDLHHGQAGSLLAIDALIRECDAVVHVIGRDPGYFPSELAVHELRERGPRDLLRSHPEILDLNQDPSTISYVHWELLLALHYEKAIFLYEPPQVDATRELSALEAAAQLEHRKRIARAADLIERCDDLEGSVWSVDALEARRSRLSWPSPSG